MTKFNFRKLKDRDGWLYALFWIIVIILIGYIFFSSNEKKIVEEQQQLLNDKKPLESKKKIILNRLEKLNEQLLALVKSRYWKLIVARVLLMFGIISLNPFYP
jgi:uncharacterized membrane-anchored protein YhcB (DUF1043 family)